MGTASLVIFKIFSLRLRGRLYNTSPLAYMQHNVRVCSCISETGEKRFNETKEFIERLIEPITDFIHWTQVEKGL